MATKQPPTLRKVIFVLLGFCAILLLIAQLTMKSPDKAHHYEIAIAPDEEIEDRVERRLRRMSLDEKIGQMTQINISVITSNSKSAPNGFVVDSAKLSKAIDTFKVGSFLNTPRGVAQPPKVWGEQVVEPIQERSMAALAIPTVYGVDQIHGTTYTMGGTLYAQGINIAATFDTALAQRLAEITAYETRASMLAWCFTPTMDTGRDPRWSRIWESYGEDCLVNAQMATAVVRGFQGEDPNHLGLYNIAACAKHYLGYGVPVSGKDRTPSSINPTDLRERYFAPFLASVRQGALSVMVNSGINNGLPLHANSEMLTTWLKDDLGWDGLIVTDWADINNLHTRDRIAETKKHAIELAINAGVDMAMVPYEYSFCEDLRALVKEGKVSMNRIDDAVRRVLRFKYRIGLFDNPTWDISQYPKFGGEEFAKAALQSAEESIVLLKNQDGALPLKQGAKVLVCGPNANSMRPLNGGWTYTWQGFRADEFACDRNTIYEAMAAKMGSENVTLVEGVTYSKAKGAKWFDEDASQIEEAVKAAEAVDVIVACLGENSYCETVGNTNDLTLSQNQRDLVKALATVGKPIILVLNSGRPRIISEIEPLAVAVVNGMLPGNYGGDATANLLLGDANFSGRLPYTYPKHINSLATYDFKPSESTAKMSGAYDYEAKIDVQWLFGEGLSYTTFKYSNLQSSISEFTHKDEITFTVDVTNTGVRYGKESILLYSSDLYASITPDNKRLRGFAKVTLAPNETTSVSITIKGSDLAFVNYRGRWTLEEGDFKILCGDQECIVKATKTKVWKTPNR